MRFRKRDGIWKVRLTINGERFERSTGCADRKAAELAAREIERDLADPQREGRRRREATTLQDVIDLAAARYKADAAKGRRSEATADFYGVRWGQVLRVLGPTTPAASVDVAMVTRYVQARRDQEMSDHTILKDVTALRVALRIARDAGLWEGSLDALVPSDLSTDYEPRTRALTIVEVQKLIRHLTPKRAAWVALMVGAGAEYAAACGAQRGDYRKADGLVRVRGTKTGDRDREVPVVLPEARALIELAFSLGGGKAPALLAPWGKIWRDLQAACVRAGIDPCSAHDLRRTFAHWHLAAGLSFEDVARAMGHASTTMLYRVYGKLKPADLRARMLAGLAPYAPREGVDSSQASQKAEGPDPRVSAENQGLSEYRRSELNQRPWDYDSQGRPGAIPLFSPWKGDGRSTWREARAPHTPRQIEKPTG
jgi:integrase